MSHSFDSGYRLASVKPDGVHWLLARNCSVSPKQMGAVFLMLCVVSLGVAGFFWTQGAILVMPFAAIELTAVAVAFLVHARHAADRERIALVQGRLLVEWEKAGVTQRREFAGSSVRVDAEPGMDRLVALKAGATVMHVGRYLRADLRPLLARELRQALRTGADRAVLGNP